MRVRRRTPSPQLTQAPKQPTTSARVPVSHFNFPTPHELPDSRTVSVRQSGLGTTAATGAGVTSPAESCSPTQVGGKK